MYSMEDGAKFGWKSTYTLDSDTDGIKNIKDHEQNGKHCLSGMAFESSPNEAQCVSTNNISFKDEILEDPYACDPLDPYFKCHITFTAG